MECPRCGHKIRGRALFCPNCGQKLEQAGEAPSRRSALRGADQLRGEGPGCGQSLLVLAIAAVVVVAIVGLGVVAVYYGQADRARMRGQVAEEHYNKGVSHLDRDEFELAIAEFEHVLDLEPDHEEALAGLAEAEQKLEAKPTPTPMLQQETKAAHLAELREAFGKRDWEAVFASADRLLALDPTYHRGEVDGMLFEAFYQSGLELVEQDRIREGARLFDRALALQPDNAQVAHARELATLYVTGIGYWGADWAKAIENLGALYRIEPEYRDVRQRIYDAHLEYGDLLAERQDPCGASEEYARAVEVQADPAAVDKRQEATALCEREPTPTAESETTTPEADEGPAAAAGTFVGHLVERTGIEGGKMFIRGRILDKSGVGVSGVRVQIRAWDWSAIAVADGNGQYAFDGLGNPVTYTLSLLDRPSLPVDVEGVWGKVTWVDFGEVK